MFISSRVRDANESITLKVNEQINKLSMSGKHVYNMTAGQLPFKPAPEFIKHIQNELNFLKSYQYSPVKGFEKLRKKFIKYVETKRDVSFKQDDLEFDCLISNGSKQSLYNVFGAILNPGDEVILITPYWVSYPEMIKFWGGEPIIVQSQAFDAFTPPLDEIKKAISSRTRAIVINSPNNPAGIHYSDECMQELASLLEEHPDLYIISDELYSEICYFDPKPRYFYQFSQKLLDRTFIIDGISKTFACTGLRIGFCIGPKKIIDGMGKIQGQTTSGPNSLIQRALIDFDFSLLENFYDPVKDQLRECAQITREVFRDYNLSHCWYQTTSAFYYLLNFERMPFFKQYHEQIVEGSEQKDFSEEIVAKILEETGVALVPGAAFGCPNSARMSMTIEMAPFREAMIKLVEYMSQKTEVFTP
jgi:aspartate aminotransferase